MLYISCNVRCWVRVCLQVPILPFVLERFAISAVSSVNLFLMVIKQMWRWLGIDCLSLASESASPHLLLIRNIIIFGARERSHLLWPARMRQFQFVWLQTYQLSQIIIASSIILG